MVRTIVAAVAAVAATAYTATGFNETAPANREDFLAEIAPKAKQMGWVAGVNSKFHGMTMKQAARLMGTKRDPARRAKLAKNPLPAMPLSALPTTFNATSNWPNAYSIGHVRDQSDCGCCWAFASTETLNDRLGIKYNYTGLLSVQDTCSCCNGDNGCSGSNGCDGGFTEDAWQYFSHTGLVTGGDSPSIGSGSTCFPYQLEMCDHHEGGPYPACPSVCSPGECATPACPNKKCSESKYTQPWAKDLHFGKSEYSINSVQEAMTQIFTNGPITSSFTVYEDFLTYKSGVYTHVSGAAMGGHAVKVVGWGTEGGVDYWLVVNSWNNYWGDWGYFKIKRGNNECGFESEFVAGDV